MTNLSEFIDLRSDTVTRPTPAMRRAMAEAEVGDDVYGEDPTVNRLERRAAEMFGKQAGLFVPTGTMGNTIGVKLHTRHGEEVICEARSHVLNYELAMLAWFSGCVARPVHADDGILRWQQIQREIRPLGPHRAPTGLIELENTHNMAGGAVMPPEVMSQICDGAHGLGLKVHLDGARIFNAAAFLETTVKDLCAGADTVMFCLSKGLCAPVGSLLVGREEAIARGRLYRKRLGEDHANARFLAEELARIPGIRVPHRVETNIVIFDVGGTGIAGPEFSRKLKARGVLINPIDERLMRLLTHHDASRAACEKALAAIEQVART